ncbi:MAG TPA: hypothetical protein V6C88_21220 [Chroococcidiopsis sp.]
MRRAELDFLVLSQMQAIARIRASHLVENLIKIVPGNNLAPILGMLRLAVH